VENALTILTGTVHGNTIELDRAPGLPDGEQVHVTVQPLSRRLPPGEGIRRSAATWNDDPEGLAEYLKQARQDRDQDRPPIEP
jgi:hypothetical protein